MNEVVQISDKGYPVAHMLIGDYIQRTKAIDEAVRRVMTIPDHGISWFLSAWKRGVVQRPPEWLVEYIRAEFRRIMSGEV